MFAFYSGAASASFAPINGEGPITTGTGADGANDPITNVGTTPAQVQDKNPAWSIITGTMWIANGEKDENGQPNGVPVNFDVNFTIPNFPGCDIQPVITVNAYGDDVVSKVLLNGTQIGPAPFKAFQGYQGTAGTTSTSTGINPGSNTLRFIATNLFGDGFGLDFLVTVLLM
jgi:hypothetical protein